MTIPERVVSFLLEVEDDDDSALVRDVAKVGMVGSWLKSIGDRDIEDVRFGFEISTSDEAVIRDNAYELERIGEIGPLDEEAWKTISQDIYRLERNCVNYMERHSIITRTEGHGSDSSLIGSAWMNSTPDSLTGDYWLPVSDALELVIDGSNEPISTGSGSLPHDQINEGVSDLGQRLVDVYIRFFNTESLNLDEWETLWKYKPQLWGVRPSDRVVEKQMLDFNQTIGTEERSGVFMSRVDGTPIFSVRCPGCKHIHGNFRTWEEASGNRMCKKCVADFVDITMKAHETGNYKKLLKRTHDKGRN